MNQSWFFEKINRIDIPLIQVTKKQIKPERDQKLVWSHMKTESWQKILQPHTELSNFYKQLYAITSEGFLEMDRYLDLYHLSARTKSWCNRKMKIILQPRQRLNQSLGSCQERKRPGSDGFICSFLIFKIDLFLFPKYKRGNKEEDVPSSDVLPKQPHWLELCQSETRSLEHHLWLPCGYGVPKLWDVLDCSPRP